MDPPHLLRLGFLLLALAAPCPSIAMSSDDPAKGAKDSSSGSTTVTVYHCKDCESSTCQSSAISFENFEKIAETQDRLFSNTIIELNTTKTRILVCFKQANPFLEGIFGIVWKKAREAGHSCGILNSGENGRANISTEEKKICCESEIDVWKHNPTLKCYTQKSDPNHTAPPADILGNPEFLTSKKSSIGTLFAFLFAGVCTGWATMYYFLRLRRGQASSQDRQGPERENCSASRTVLLSCDVQQPAEQQMDFA